MSIPLTKINPNCSNDIQLIDVNSCLGDNIDIINQNIINLSNAAFKMYNDIQNVEISAGLTNFYSLSTNMIETLINIENINKAYIQPYTLLQQNSAVYSYKQFSVYYPFLDIVDSTNYTTKFNQTTGLVLDWLNQYFNPSLFSNGQIINVFLTWQCRNFFTYLFDGSLQEKCTPKESSDNKVSCDGCGSINYGVGLCNHDTGGKHWCDNAYSYCSVSYTNSQQSYTCAGHVGNTTYISEDNQYTNINTSNDGNSGNLRIHYTQEGYDTFLSRIDQLIFQNNNDSWSLRQ
jgi:hypothetical protein